MTSSARTSVAVLLAAGSFTLVGVRTATAQRIQGIDVSQFQGTINWTTVARPVAQGGAEKKFAFIRATRGRSSAAETVDAPYLNATGYVDTRFTTNYPQARAAGLKVGAYHFGRWDLWTPGDTTGVNAPAKEAAHFLSVAGAYLQPGDLRPVLDLELDGDRPAATVNNYSRTQLTDWALAFCEYITVARGWQYRPIIYVNGSFATSEVDTRLNSFPLWLARYGSEGDPTTTGQPLAFSAGGYSTIYGVWNPSNDLNNHPWNFWQYSSTGRIPGITGNVDLDVFNTSLYQSLDSFTISGTIPEPTTLATLTLPALTLLRRRR